MRLLNVHSLELKEFIGDSIPRYCILSHRWGEDEVSYKEFRKGLVTTGQGYRKIVNFCEVVKTFPAHLYSSSPRGFGTVDWVWIDTCCIDKRSSSELSEAINSMFDWYQKACECFVYLQDVKEGYSKRGSNNSPGNFRCSNWFTRGWTLQELLAPEAVVFLNASWEVIGHLSKQYLWTISHFEYYGAELQDAVAEITKIPTKYLSGESSVKQASIAIRMSWASDRTTTRVEDEAYCLLGIFGINMPLIYGEGSKAFQRLQEEIVKRSTDQSIFAWKPPMFPGYYPMLANSPRRFRSCKTGFERPLLSDRPYTITNNGLELRALLSPLSSGQNDFVLTFPNKPGSNQVRLRVHAITPNFYCRVMHGMEDVDPIAEETIEEQTIYLATGGELTYPHNFE